MADSEGCAWSGAAAQGGCSRCVCYTLIKLGCPAVEYAHGRRKTFGAGPSEESIARAGPRVGPRAHLLPQFRYGSKDGEACWQGEPQQAQYSLAAHENLECHQTLPGSVDCWQRWIFATAKGCLALRRRLPCVGLWVLSWLGRNGRTCADWWTGDLQQRIHGRVPVAALAVRCGARPKPCV